MAKNEVCPELTRLLRLQRHEFINHIQVVHALLQLGKIEKAKQYLEDLAKSPELTSGVMSDYKQENCSIQALYPSVGSVNTVKEK